MEQSFEEWKKELEGHASEVVEPSKSEIDEAVYAAAAQMGHAEDIKTGERPIDATIKQLEAEGWHYRGPVSGKAVFEAGAGENQEIRIIGTGAQRFLFERAKGAN